MSLPLRRGGLGSKPGSGERFGVRVGTPFVWAAIAFDQKLKSADAHHLHVI